MSIKLPLVGKKASFKDFLKKKQPQTNGSSPVVYDMEKALSETLYVSGKQMGKTAMTTEWFIKELQKPPEDFLKEYTATHNVGFDLAVPTGSADLIKQQAVASFAKAFDEAFKTNFAPPPEQFEVCCEANPCRDPLPPPGGRAPGELRWMHEDVDVEKDIVHKRIVLCCRHCSLVRDFPLQALYGLVNYNSSSEIQEWVRKEMTL